MPRAASTTSKDKKVAVKKPRAKAPVKKTTTKRATTKKSTPTRAKSTAAKTPRKQPVPKTTKEEVIETESVIETVEESAEPAVKPSKKRKAPTAFESTAKTKKARQVQIAVVAALMTIGIGASAAVGFTDAGQINVAQTIQDRNNRMANMVDVDGPTVVAPAPINAGTPGVPDGGLIGLQPAPALKTPQELAANVAGTSTSTASSTDSVVASSTATSSEMENEVAADRDGRPQVDNVVTHSATTSVEASSSEDRAEAVE